MIKRQRNVLMFLIAVVGFFMLGPGSKAGPPLICHEIEVSEGQSLPWGKDTFTRSSAYNASNVVRDALDLLRPQTAVLTRMETLRRATLYIDRNKAQADELLGHLMARALDAEAAGKPDSLAWFDAGYAVACYRQTGTPRTFGPAVTKGEGASAIEGYSWIARAIALQGSKADPALNVAAALVTADSRAPEHQQHVQKAISGGFGKGSSEERKLLEWLEQINGRSAGSSR